MDLSKSLAHDRDTLELLISQQSRKAKGEEYPDQKPDSRAQARVEQLQPIRNDLNKLTQRLERFGSRVAGILPALEAIEEDRLAVLQRVRGIMAE